VGKPSKTTAQGEIIMKESALDRMLIDARPENYKIAANFTDRVMAGIKTPTSLTVQFGSSKRNKKNSLKKRLTRLPRFAVILIAIGVLLALSGTTYALYKTLWLQSAVHVTKETKSTVGRTQVVLSLSQCNSDGDVASHYELKSNATITADEVPHVVQAHCELDAIQNWATMTFPNEGLAGRMATSTTAHNVTQVTTSMATHITLSSNSSITFAGLTKYNQSDTTFAVGPNVQYIADGQNVKSSTISPLDPVVYVTSDVMRDTPSAGCTPQSCSMSGTQVSSTLVAVVKLNLSFQYYDQFAWQSLTEIDACMGNPSNNCLTGYAGSIDLFEPASNPNPPSDGTTKEIQGVITAINGATVIIQSSSGSLYTITAPSDVISAYNTNKAKQYYNSQFVTVGKSLDVIYIESADKHAQTISPSQIEGISFMLELVSKGSPVTAY
jgi:cytoskeletal protein RodZ